MFKGHCFLDVKLVMLANVLFDSEDVKVSFEISLIETGHFIKGAESHNHTQTCYLYNVLLFTCSHLCSAQILVGVNPHCFPPKFKNPSSKHLHSEKSSGKSLWCGLSRMLQNCHSIDAFLHYLTLPL